MTDDLSADDVAEMVDRRCTQFETAWSQGQAPSLDAFLHDLDDRWVAPLLRSLIPLDIESRLRNGRVDAPLLESYWQRFGGWLGNDVLSELVIKDYQYRQQWGDRPSIHGYLRRFPCIADEVETSLREFAAQVTPTVLQVYQDARCAFETRLVRPLELGRQRRGEPGPFRLVRCARGDRIVIAPATEQPYSRRHLQVEIVARNRVCVTNCARRGSVRIQLGGVIEPGQTVEVTRPSVLIVFELAIRLST